MIIERFYANKTKALYQRFEEKGRLLPEGVEYLDSWVDEKLETCFQLMAAESIDLLQQWIANWDDLAAFEIFRVIDSGEAKRKALSES